MMQKMLATMLRQEAVEEDHELLFEKDYAVSCSRKKSRNTPHE
jgi:hypothetical protein